MCLRRRLGNAMHRRPARPTPEAPTTVPTTDSSTRKWTVQRVLLVWMLWTRAFLTELNKRRQQPFHENTLWARRVCRGSRTRKMEVTDLERPAAQGGRPKPGPLGSKSADGNMALGEAVQWAAGALDKIQVRSPSTLRYFFCCWESVVLLSRCGGGGGRCHPLGAIQSS